VETVTGIPPDAVGIRRDCSGPAKQLRLTRTRNGKLRLLNRESLDRRTAVARVYDRLVTAIHTDLGGRDQLSAIELALIEAFAGASVVTDNINTRILAGAEIDNALITMHASAISAMVRVASRLGLQRRQREITPSLGDILNMDASQQLHAVEQADVP
jgi:hypothetical protein